MNTDKDPLLKIIDELPEKEIRIILDFAEQIKAKKEIKLFEDLSKATESSLDFWNYDLDDEVWNNV